MTAIREATTADAEGIAPVHVESNRTTYRGIVPADFLASLSHADLAGAWAHTLTHPQPDSVFYVAEDEHGQIVGFAIGGPKRRGDPAYQGELYGIYLLEAHQGQGTGRRLAVAVAEWLAQAGMSSMLVWVLADNPSRTFYGALGGQRAGEKHIEIGGATLIEVAYGWPDVNVLLAHSASR